MHAVIFLMAFFFSSLLFGQEGVENEDDLQGENDGPVSETLEGEEETTFEDQADSDLTERKQNDDFLI